jgi:hypothetical protein
LNHSEQFILFNELSENFNKIVGIRIEISSKNPNTFSLVWLMRCLVQNLDDVSYARLPLDSQRYRMSNNFQLLLEGISEGLKLSGCQRETPVKTIIEKICERMLKDEQNIILVLYGVDSQIKCSLDKILNDFWNPLIQEVKKANIDRYLLMFWIDYKKSIDWRDSYVFSKDKNIENANMPFDVGSVTNTFKKKDIQGWIERPKAMSIIANYNREAVNKEKINSTIKTIWQESQKGKPEFLLQAIYKLCKLRWEDYETRWQDF